MKDNGFKLREGRFRLKIRKKFFTLIPYSKGSEALEQDAQTICGCSIPEHAQGHDGWNSE